MKKPLSQGFTLIELIASISIIVIVTSVVVFQYRNYESTTTMRGQVHEIALALREAQVNATNGKEFAPNTNKFRFQYAVKFNKSVTPPTFYLYGDHNAPFGTLDTTTNPNTNELLAQYTLRKGYTFDICAKASESSATCDTPTELTVYYNYASSTANLKSPTTSYGYVEISVYKIGQTANQEKVRIWSVGRIEN
jgi:prepilin-type N-terminal cleavage/methylation domain-containing protein